MAIRSNRGFTFIEVILVVAIVSTVGILSAAFSGLWFFGRGTESTLEMLRSTLRQAQVYSMEGRDGAAWGVAVRDDNIVLFRGTSYDTRDVALDATYDISFGVTISNYDTSVADRGSGRLSGTLEGIQISGFGEVIAFSLSEDGGFLFE